MGKKLLLLFVLALSIVPSSIAQNNAEYNPDPNAPTHEKMFEELFGVPEDATWMPEVFHSAEPPELMADALHILWTIAMVALFIIIIMQLLTSTINAPTSNTLLGDRIGTAFAPIKIALAVAFLISTPGSYSIIESIVLSVNKYTSSLANEINESAANRILDSESSLNFKTASLTVNDDAALNLFKGAMCVEYLNSQGESEAINIEPLSKQTNYQLLFGQRTNVNFSPIFSLGGTYPIEGGCGQWYTNMSRPRGLRYVESGDVDESAFIENSSVQFILQVLQFGTAHRSLVNSDLYTEFRELSVELLNREEGTKEQYFVTRFDEIVNDFNIKATKMLREKLQSEVIAQIVSQDEMTVIEDSIQNGWFFAGAMPFTLASVHDKYQTFKRVGLIATAPMPEHFYQHSDELEEHMGYLDKLIKGNRSQIDPATNLVNESIRSDVGGYGSCVMDMHGLFDCFGYVVALETIHLAESFTEEGVNPLIITHDVGSQGADDLLSWQLSLNTAYVASSAAVGFADNGFITSGVLSFIAHAAHATVEILRSNSGFIIKYLMVLYAFLGYYIPLMALLYFMVAVISYIVMLFVSVLSANFFAVGHAWLEGQGVISSYAQRGYPSFIFASLHPILIIAAFYIYLFAIQFIFKYVGYAYSIGVTQIFSLSAPNIFSGLTVFTVFVTLLIVIHRLLAKFTIDMPDRIMRTIGVHEALSSHDFTGEIESRSGGDNKQLIEAGSDRIDAQTGKASSPSDNKYAGVNRASGTGGNGQNANQPDRGVDSATNQKLSDSARDQSDRSHEAGSHFDDDSVGQRGQTEDVTNNYDSQPLSQGKQEGSKDQSEMSYTNTNNRDVDGTSDTATDGAINEPKKVQNPNDFGMAGGAMGLGLKAGHKYAQSKAKKESETVTADVSSDNDSEIKDKRSDEIKAAQEMSNKLEDSASSNNYQTPDMANDVDQLSDDENEVVSGGQNKFDSPGDEPMTDEEFEKMHKNIKENEDGKDGPVE